MRRRAHGGGRPAFGGWQGLLALLLLVGPALLALFSSAPTIEATHVAYGTINWVRAPGFNPTTCAAGAVGAWNSGCTTRFTFKVAIRTSFGSMCQSVAIGNTLCVGGISYFPQGISSGYYHGTSVKPTMIHATKDYYLADGSWDYNMPKGASHGVWQLCCRLSSLRDSNGDNTGSVPVRVLTTLAASPTTTGTHRVYAQRLQPLPYAIPAAPSSSGRQIRFSVAPGGDPTSSDPTKSSLSTPKPSGFVLDSVTGMVTWTPTINGLYAVQVRIEEGPVGGSWDMWIVLDFIIEVMDVCTTCNQPPVFAAQPVAHDFYRGIEGSVTVSATDPNPADTVTIIPASLPAGVSVTQIGFGRTGTSRIRWTPQLDSNPQVVCFQAQDNHQLMSFGQKCVNLNIGEGHIIYVSGIIRDFRKTHVDFNVCNTGNCDAGVSFVSRNLGADDKPAFVATSGLQHVRQFNQWFNDVNGVNMRMVHSVILSNGSVPDGRIFTFRTNEFWVIDNLLFGNDGDAHNNFFTYEVHTYIVYQGGEVYEFSAQDDLFVYMDRKMSPTWNLQGIRATAITHTMNMDSLSNGGWNFVLEGIYTCSIFYAHRSGGHNPGLQLQLPNAVLCDALSSGETEIDFRNFKLPAPADTEGLTLIGRPQVIARPSGVPSNGGTSGPMLRLIGNNEFNDGGAAYYAIQQRVGDQNLLISREQKVLQGFATSFDFVFMNPLNGAPEGFAFVFQSDGPTSRGNDGAGLGYHMLSKSVAIEFDTKYTASNADPSYNHVSLHTRYGQPNSAHEQYSLGISNNNPPMNLNNGTMHRIRIEYSPAKEDTQSANKLGWVRMWMNSVLAPVLQAQVDDDQLRAHFGGAAFVGFTVGSGAENAGSANILLYNWNMVIVPPSATQSGIVAQALTMEAGGMQARTYHQDKVLRPGQLVVQLRDSCGNIIPVGNEPWLFTVRLSRRVGGAVIDVNPNTQIFPNGDGSYTITFNPTLIGFYDIDVKFTGIPILNNPFEVNVVSAISAWQQSAIVFSRVPYAPHNAPSRTGLFVVGVDRVTGRVLGQQQFDMTVNAQVTAFSDMIAGLPTGSPVALACGGSRCNGGVAAGTVGNQIGCSLLASVGATSSYACVGTKGSATGVVQAHHIDRATDVLYRRFPETVTGSGNGFDVTAASGDARFGMVDVGTGGGFAQILVIPDTVLVPADSIGSFVTVCRDRFLNPQTNHHDAVSVSFDPDITLIGGTLTGPIGIGAGVLGFDFEHRVAGRYTIYSRMTNAQLSFREMSNSPFDVVIVAGKATASTSFATGPGLSSARSGLQACFDLTLKDKYFNTLEDVNPITPDVIKVRLIGPETLCEAGVTGCTRAGVVTHGWVGAVAPKIFQVCYTASVTGVYDIEITVNDEIMSPMADTTVVPGLLHAPTSFVSDADANPVTPQAAVAGESSFFLLQARDLNNNRLQVRSFPGFELLWANPTNVVTSAVTYEGQGRYRVTFTINKSGPHGLTVINGAPLCTAPGATEECLQQDAHRPLGNPQQPMTIQVVTGPVHQNSILSGVPNTLAAGTVVTHRIEARDAQQNLITGRDQMSAFVHRIVTDPQTGSAVSVAATVVQPTTALPAVYPVTYTPTIAATYFVDVVTASTGDALTGVAPAQGSQPRGNIMTVSPAATDCNEFLFGGNSGQWGGDAGSSASFTIRPRDRFRNPQTPTIPHTFRMYLDRGTADEQEIVQWNGVGPAPTYYWRYSTTTGLVEVEYLTPMCTNGFQITLIWNDGSPNGCTFWDQSVPCSVSGLINNARPECGFATAKAGRRHTFCLIDYVLEDPYSALPPYEYKKDSVSFSVVVYDPLSDYVQPDIFVDTGIVDVTYNYSVEYVPTRIGTYLMNVTTVMAQMPARAQPFTIVVGPGDIYPPNCRVIGLSAQATMGNSRVAGVQNFFWLELRDEFNNIITQPDVGGVIQFKASFSPLPGETNPPAALTGAWMANNSMIEFAYTIQRAGMRLVVVTETQLDRPLMQAGHDLNIVHAAAVPALSWASGAGVVLATAGEFAFFEVVVRDAFNNPATTSATGRLTAYFADDSATEYTPVYKGNSAYSFQYNTTIASDFGTGCTQLWARNLTVRMDNVLIGSDASVSNPQPAIGYGVRVSPNRLSASRSAVSGISGQNHIAGEDLVFTFSARDLYGNPWCRVGSGGLVTAQGYLCKGGDCSDKGQVQQVEHPNSVHVGDGVHSLTLRAGSSHLQQVGLYQLEITADGSKVETLPHPASRRATVVPAAPSAPQTQIVPEQVADVMAGEVNTLRIRLSDRFGNAVTDFGSHNISLQFVSAHINCDLSEVERADLTFSNDFEYTVAADADGWYDVSFTSTVMGSFTLEILVNSDRIGCKGSRQTTFRVRPGLGRADNSIVSGPETAIAGTELVYLVQIRDMYGNNIDRHSESLDPLDVEFGVPATGSPAVPTEFGAPSTWLSLANSGVASLEVTNQTVGLYQVRVQATTAVTYPIVSTYQGGFVSGPGSLTSVSVTHAPPYTFDTPVFQVTTAGRPTSFTLQARDKFQNLATSDNHTYSVLAWRMGAGMPYEVRGAVTNLGDGQHSVNLLAEWAGSYSVRIELVGGVALTFPLTVNHQTCGYDLEAPDVVSATPYRCPDGTCVASYEDCVGLDLCPAEAPVRCAADDSCVADVSLCPCAVGQTRCPAGNCATSCQTPPPCPSGTEMCLNANGDFTGECRANPETDCPTPRVCTPGQVLCGDGWTCVSSAGQCPAAPTCPIGQVLCASGICAMDATHCPTPVTCGAGQVQCAADGRCVDSALECPEQYTCPADLTFRCADGSCRASASLCPSQAVCPAGQLLCPSGRCAQTAADCVAPVPYCPLNRVRCPDGTCVENTMHCPTTVSCPPLQPVLCASGACASSLTECQPAPSGCASHGRCLAFPEDTSGKACMQCPDGTCVLRSDENEDGLQDFTCPTGVLCPSSHPVVCPDGSCVATAADCPVQMPCPSERPVRCPSGSCASSLADCPSESSCPTSMPVRCPDGRCAITVLECVDPELLQCPSGSVRCAGGECALAEGLCPTHVTCPMGSAKCADGTCRPATPGCPTDVYTCPVTQVTCPQSSAGVQCAASIGLCPQTAACPAELPVLCLDRTCANTAANCPPVPRDIGDRIVCPDGSVVGKQADCGVPVTCTPDRPFKCRDETCRRAPADCPVAEAGSCGGATPYMCPNGRCVASLFGGLCGDSVADPCPNQLNQAKPFEIRCPNGTCVEFLSNCTSGVIDHCPHGLSLCRDGSCQAEDACLPAKCPANLPHLCPDGLCAANSAGCSQANGCPAHLPVRCPNGACAAARDQCVSVEGNPCIGDPSGSHFCLYSARCASDEAECGEFEDNGCGFNEQRCLDGTCVGPNEVSTCTNPVGGGPNSCPLFAPYRCPDGFCATSSLACPPPLLDSDACPEQYPIRCASGNCVPNSAQCPTVSPCGHEAGTERCEDGSCRVGLTCPKVNTCPLVSGSTTDRMVRCPNGLCARDQNLCINPETGCPDGWGVCPTGVCVQDQAECAQHEQPSNGCPVATPARCSFDNSCKASAADCLNQAGCPVGQPFRCPLDGACVDDPDTCSTTPCVGVICADGSCEAEAKNCRARNGCDANAPVRCVDGSCAKYSANSGMPAADSCPAAPVCNAGEKLCADGRCVPQDSNLCQLVQTCLPTEFRCPDLRCVTDIAQCNNQLCPPKVPVRCPSGLCKSSPSECSQDQGNANTCRAPNAFRCADGSCKANSGACLEWLKEIHDTDAVEGICPGTVPCPSYVILPPGSNATCSPVVCPDGSCAANKYLCAPIPSCPLGQLRCSDGSCRIAPAGTGPAELCPELPSCNTANGYRRCEDGTCRKDCLPYHGCGLESPFHCANRECATHNDIGQCTKRRSAAPQYQLIERESAPGATASFLGLLDDAAAGTGAVAARRLLQTSDPNDPLSDQATARFSTVPSAADWRGPTNIATNQYWLYPGEDWEPKGTPCTSNCVSQTRVSSGTYTVDSQVDGNLVIATDSNGVARARLIVPAAAIVSSTGSAAIEVREVAESRLRPVANRVTYIRRQQHWGRYMGFSETLLSPAFECVAADTKDQPFRVNVTYRADFDRTRYPDLRDVCLAYVHALDTGLFVGLQWRCVQGEHRQTQTVNPALSPIIGNDQSRVVSSFGRCGVDGTIYGFIHSPSWMPVRLPTVSSDWFAENMLWIFLAAVGLVIAIFLVAYLLKRMRRYRKKYHEERQEVDRAQDEVDTMMQFGGRAGTKDEEVAMTDNPLVTQMEDMQKRLDDNAMELQQAQLDEQQMESDERQDHIYRLKDDRNELQDELERLKAQLVEGQAVVHAGKSSTAANLDFGAADTPATTARRTTMTTNAGGRRKRDM